MPQREMPPPNGIEARGYPPTLTPTYFDPHVCSPPSTANFIGREMDFACACGGGAGDWITTSGGRFAPRAVVDPALKAR
jgi:hypothetical protein